MKFENTQNTKPLRTILSSVLGDGSTRFSNFLFFLKSTHLGLWFIPYFFFSSLASNSGRCLNLKFDSPFHYAAWSQILWQHHAGQCQISPLCFAVGSQISLLQIATVSRVNDFCRNLPAAWCSKEWNWKFLGKSSCCITQMGSNDSMLHDAAGSQVKNSLGY